MFEDFPTPMIFGHRGASASAPENTLPSFELALSQGADAVELDVKLTADEQAVVIHDPTVDRTTDGTGRVNRLRLSEIKKLDAGKYFKPEFEGVRIPTLDEVFESVGKRILINVELTNYSSPGDNLIPIVAYIVQRHQLDKDVFFSSFSGGNLRHMKVLLPDTPVAILCQGGFPGFFARSSLLVKTSPINIHPNLSDVNERLVKKEHDRNRRVHVWTVNKDTDILMLRDLDVDGLITDDPHNALRVLGRV
jgi:glycerophosphoryl diester phosphodiesterase